MSDEINAGLGHNNPPEITEIMAQEQKEKYAEKLAEIEARLIKEQTVPTVVNDDNAAGVASDFIKLAKATIKETENIRLAEKKIYTVKSDAIQAFWKKRLSPLEDAIKRIDERLAPYLKEKEDRKRREAEEKARRENEERERRAREAEEKERIAREEAAIALREKEEIERKAKEERERAEREKEEARKKADAEAAEIRRVAEEEKRLAAEKAAAAQAEIDRLKREKEERDRAEKLKEEKDIEEKKRQDDEHKAALAAAKEAGIRAEQERIEANRKAREDERLAREKEKEGAAIVKEIEKDVREFEREAQAEARDVSRDAETAAREADDAIDRWARQDKVALKAERATMAKSAEFSRTRGDGSMATVVERWIGSPRGREELRPAAMLLWDHIPMAALEQAVQAAVDAGERNIPGAIISIESKAQVR